MRFGAGKRRRLIGAFVSVSVVVVIVGSTLMATSTKARHVSRATAGLHQSGGERAQGAPSGLQPAKLTGGASAGVTLKLHHHATATSEQTPQHPGKPNIVFVLTDDLSENLVPYLPQLRRMQSTGMSFSNYFVTDSLCCPSRSSIFTGDFPHDTGVYTNHSKHGGIAAFFRHGDQNHTFNLALHHAGYRTALMGKYLNGYQTHQSPLPTKRVPKGWDQWEVTGDAGYKEFNYPLNVNGKIQKHGHKPGDYLVGLMARRGAAFIKRQSRADNPFFLELATYAPHKPYAYAPRYRHLYPHATYPRTPAFNRLPTHPSRWLSGHHKFGPNAIRVFNQKFRERLRAIQGVNALMQRIRATVAAEHQRRETYVVFSSDNGYHMGEYELQVGKQTAFDTDIHVPLVMTGPGIPHGASSDAMTENTDLAPTFERLAGLKPICDGHSLTGLLGGKATPHGWRNAVLVEHHGPNHDFRDDPDAQGFNAGDPTTYQAIRERTFTYVQYVDGQHEYYNLTKDPFELHNVYRQLSQARQTELTRELARMHHCHGARACWAAEHVPSNAGGPGPGPGPKSCPATIGVAVRGDGPGGGRFSDPVVRGVQTDEAGRMLAGHDLVYPTASPGDFAASRAAGDQRLDGYLSRQAERCAGTRFVLVGWGEGALVIADELHHLTVHPAPVGRRIAAVVLNGDPAFRSGKERDHGSYQRGLSGVLVGDVGSIAPFNDVTGSWCVRGDPVCQQGSRGHAHAAYGRYRTAEVDFILRKLGDAAAGVRGGGHRARPGRRRPPAAKPVHRRHPHRAHHHRRRHRAHHLRRRHRGGLRR